MAEAAKPRRRAAIHIGSAAVRAIDVQHMGRERVICCWELDGVLIDPGPQSSEGTLIEALGDEAPRAIVLTHIHLDHAGATGSLVRRWPDTPVYVHENGAPHLIDPSKLWASAGQLWDDMDERWGETVPVPEDNITLVGDGDTVFGMRVAYTPGHASHHVSYLHEASGWAFVGDVAGVRVPPINHTLMPTPPPDIDVEAWLESLALVESWSPQTIAVTHFGAHEDVGDTLDEARTELRRWAEVARGTDEEEFERRFHADLAERIDDEQVLAAITQASDPRLEYAGLARYWRKLGNERHPAY
jgi:glyoxylase-like metal-dependent hydrolase (beta-lactamase superfamily II)